MSEREIQRQAERFAALQWAVKHEHTLVVQAALVSLAKLVAGRGWE